MLNKVRIVSVCIYLSFLVGLSACQSQWIDSNEGETIKAAIYTQSVYPDGRKDIPTSPSGLDGVAAKATMDNYQRSFIVPATAAGTSGSSVPPSGSPVGGATTGASPF